MAEALLPPGGALPGAEGSDGVPVAAPVSDLVAGMSPRTRLLVRTGLRACEWSTFPRRFSRLSRERRAARLVKLAASGRLRRDLALLLKTLSCIAYARDPGVQATLGVSSRCERANGAAPDPPPAPPLRPDALVPPDGVERCDVVVVGSGAGGAAAARTLAERGLDVVVVEEGDYHDARDYETDPLAALPMLYRDGGLTFAEGSRRAPCRWGAASAARR